MIRRKNEKKLCAMCHEKKALFFVRSSIKFKKDHNLCFRCYRSLLNRLLSYVQE